jgi:formylglycine-generating enzyme required for sulfatase activity
MVWIPGGTFAMGRKRIIPKSDRFTAPRGRVLDGPLSRHERAVSHVCRATNHVTFAEIPPNAADYPGAKPDMLYAGSLVFVKPPGRVDRRDIGNWWQYLRGADWRHPYGPQSASTGWTIIPSCT